MTAHPKPSVTQAVEWLRAISTWLLETDNDMKLPSGILDTDPLDIADALRSAEAASRDAIEEWKNEAAFYRHEARVRQSAEAASRAREDAFAAEVVRLREFIAATEAVEAARRVAAAARYPEDIRDANRDFCGAIERLEHARAALSASDGEVPA